VALAPFNYAYLRNCRMYVPQRFSPRGGQFKLSTVPVIAGQPVHSIRALNDRSIPGLSVGLVIGCGGQLNISTLSFPSDSGYSTNPLAMFPYRPDQSPEPWMYIADFNKMRKIRIDGLVHSVGIEPPLAAPVVDFGPDVFLAISNFAGGATWANAGTAGAVTPNVTRVSDVIAQIIYVSGLTGFASIVPLSGMAGNYGKGMLIQVGSGGQLETALVQDVFQGTSPLAIQSIIYDTGSTGLCTIQPTQGTVAAPNKNLPASVATGPARFNPGIRGTEDVLLKNTARRVPIPLRPPTGTTISPSTQSVGFQPNAVVRLNAGGGPNDEFVRIISVSNGPNGQASFRCVTVNNHGAGESLQGIPSFRAFLTKPHFGGEALKDVSLSFALTAGQGWIQNISPQNLASAPPNPIQESDNIHLSIFMDHPEFLTEARILLDVDASTNDFAHNYFYSALRQSDSQQAVLSNQTTAAARTAAITKTSVDNLGILFGKGVYEGPLMIGKQGGIITAPFNPGGPYTVSKQASTGTGQWTEFVFKVSDLVRVGADTSRTLANVAGIRIFFQVSSAVNIKVGDLWIGGTYGPDVGTTGSPIFYRFRGRSQVTGVKSLAGPATRSGVTPHNQSVVVQGTAHPNPAVDTNDVFRWGSTLTQWTYVGSAPNNSNWEFLDTLSDTDIANNPLLEQDVFQPFPTIDLPRKGVCSTAGTKVILLSGDTFNPQWYPGSQININGIFYTLYSQPVGNTLEIVENAGTQFIVPFQINQATLLGQPHYAFWGPYAEGTASYFFSCGDALQPGVLFITLGNDPDSAPDTLQEEITSPSEPLMNGCMYGQTPYVWSSDKFYRLFPNLGSTVTAPTLLDPSATQLFIPQKISEKGLWSPWAFCVGDSMYYLSKDGIYKNQGNESQSITDEDLYLLFPHDGKPGEAVTIGGITFNPPNMALNSSLRMSCVQKHIYFDYVDTLGVQRTMVYSEVSGIWGVDDYAAPVVMHYDLEGPATQEMLMGGADGNVYNDTGVDQDVGNAFPVEIRMPQLSELEGAYTVVEDGLLGLQASQQGNISLVINVDGTDNLITVPVTTAYSKVYTRVTPTKGKILAFALVGSFPFAAFLRDCQFNIGKWGRSEMCTPVNPFSRPTRAMEAKAG
jgi:hypothetical protein